MLIFEIESLERSTGFTVGRWTQDSFSVMFPSVSSVRSRFVLKNNPKTTWQHLSLKRTRMNLNTWKGSLHYTTSMTYSLLKAKQERTHCTSLWSSNAGRSILRNGSLNYSPSYYFRIKQHDRILSCCKFFSNKANHDHESKDKETANEKAKDTQESQEGKTPSGPVVDKAFVEYLTGGTDDPLTTLEQAEKLAASSSNKHQTLHTPTTEQSETTFETKANTTKSTTTSTTTSSSTSTTKPPPDWFNNLLLSRSGSDLFRKQHENNLDETYKSMQQIQVMKLKKSRSKQASNVRRALGGNVLIAGSKLAAYLSSGSSAMLSEFIHSVVDCGNQSLLLLGLRDSGHEADREHQYGYGKSIYFWALVSALGTFFLGAGVGLSQAVPNLISGGSLHEIHSHVWGVLAFSFVVDGYVFTKTLLEVKESMPEGGNLWKHVWKLRDPATLAVLLEDGAACLGIVMAIGGIAATQAYNAPVFDALAGVGISGLLAAMGLILVNVNHKFLLGQAVDTEIRTGIEKILLNRRSIDHVHSIQSQWTGPETFSFKAEVDFDGTFLAAKLMPRYQEEFVKARNSLDQDLRVLLSWYAEDVMRTVEREIRHIEAEIRQVYPGAQYIELEPMSKDADRFAIDDGLEASLKRIEIENLNRYLKSLYQPSSDDKKS